LDDNQVGRILSILGYAFTIKTTPEMERQFLTELADQTALIREVEQAVEGG
jgi:hypothetical protein